MGSFATDPKRHVARKEHQCDVCLYKIAPGTTYVTWSGRFEGDFYTNHLHEPCYAVTHNLDSEYGELPTIEGMNPEEALEEFATVGCLREALTYYKPDWTDTRFEGLTDSEIARMVCQDTSERRDLWLAELRRKIERHAPIYAYERERAVQMGWLKPKEDACA